MKIVFIGQKGIPAITGGVESHVEELAVRLVKSGHEVSAYTRPNYTNPKLKKYKGVNLISLKSIASKHLDAITHTFRACLDVRKREVDVIHFHSIGPSSLIWLVRMLKPKTPVVATFHTQCYKHQKWGLLAKMYLKFGERVICKSPDKTIVISKNLKKYAFEKYACDAVYAPNGVSIPENRIARDIKKQWGLTEGSYIVAVQRLIRHKGVHYLIEAYNKLRTNKKLVIVGAGTFTDDYVAELKAMAKDNPNIIFTGNQTGRTLNELYSNAYMFVQPSESEGLSIALLEAMAYGKACLVSDIPENREAVGSIGRTFVNKNPMDLALNLLYLLKQEKLVKKMGQLGRTRVAKNYDWDGITKKVIKIYETTIEEKEAYEEAKELSKQAKLNRVTA